MLGELAGEHEADRGLDLPGRERRLLGEAAELGGLEGDALEDVVDERVHDRHALLGDARVGVHLLEHAVDVRGVRLDARLLPLAAGGLLGRLGGFLGGRSWGQAQFYEKMEMWEALHSFILIPVPILIHSRMICFRL